MATNTSVSVGATSTSVLTTSFRACVITNVGDTSVVWLKIGESGDAEVGKGIPLSPAASTGAIGGSFAINDASLFQSPITAISASGTNSVAVWYV